MEQGKSLFSLTQENQENFKSTAAWFLGAKGENGDLVSELSQQIVEEHAHFRSTHYKESDAPYITDDIKNSKEYQQAVDKMKDTLHRLQEKLHQSVPFFSQRYQAHMDWDTVTPANMGYLAAMLYNQNNVATEGGPATCKLEKEVGQQLCTLLGFDKEAGWGHITADGSIANLEAMWVARNIKFYPLAIKKALCVHKDRLQEAVDKLCVEVYDEAKHCIRNVKVTDCTDWQLLNISPDETAALPEKIIELCGLKANELDGYLAPFLLQNVGIMEYAREYPDIRKIKIFVPVTRHYSWPKAATVLGLGQDSVIGIPVDDNCRMDVNKLEYELNQCAEHKIPVLMTVAVIGSTEEGVIDNLHDILEIKENVRCNGLMFQLHCDAAWGGYLRTLMINPEAKADAITSYVPALPLSSYAQIQYNNLKYADTITIDPHKSGFVPYPAGALCYRNGRLRYLITFNADYIHSNPDDNMGIFGLEGSKPGAAAAAVWAAHESIGLDNTGYGQILGECMYSAKLYYCYWLTLADENDKFDIQTLIPLPDKIEYADGRTFLDGKQKILSFIRNNIIGKTNEEIAQNTDALLLLQQIGSDVLINSFLVNFKDGSEMNRDLDKLNTLNQKLFERFSITDTKQVEKDEVEYMLTLSKLNSQDYQQAFSRICGQWNIDVNGRTSYSLSFLINTILQPWPNTPEFIHSIMMVFKEGIVSCIQEVAGQNAGLTVEDNSSKAFFEDQVYQIPSDIEATPTRWYRLNNSYAGYADAEPSGRNKLFYWFFESRIPPVVQTPLIIWLNGGPGASSLAGLFLENGPFTMKDDSSIVPNRYSWNEKAHMLFFDQPVGTGYSCIKGYQCIRTEQEMARQFVYALQEFYTCHPIYRNAPLYLTGESYAGKYIPYIAKEITDKNKENAQIPLKGIALGDGWIDPEKQTADQIAYAYMLGMVDTKQRKKAEQLYDKFQKDIQAHDMAQAFTDGNKVSQYLVNCGGGENIYDIRSWADAPIEPLKNYLSNNVVKRCIHVPQDVEWAFSDAGSEVADNLMDDLMAPVTSVIQEVINMQKEDGTPLYQILLYTGNFDMSCGFTGTEQALADLDWEGREAWNKLDREVWYKLDKDGKTKITQGCIKHYSNLMQIEIPMSGHQVPLFQPQISKDMIYNWIFLRDFLTYVPEE